MAAIETPPMARTKKKPVTAPTSHGRTTIINLKGTDDQAEWLESVHRKTHLAKSVIVRLALDAWASKNGHPSFPVEETKARA